VIGDSADFPPWHPVLPARQYEQQQTPHYDLLAVVEACVQGPWPMIVGQRPSKRPTNRCIENPDSRVNDQNRAKH
jgi:hypothetical protein